MPNVPQLVPVANASPMATRKKIGGSSMMSAVWALTMPPTKPPRFRYLSLQIPDSVHARHRIKMAGVMALKPQPKLSQKALKDNTLRGRYKIPVNTKAMKEPSTSDFEESQPAKASAMLLPS